MKSTKKGLIVLIVIIFIAILSGIISAAKKTDSESKNVKNVRETSVFNFALGKNKNGFDFENKFQKNYIAVLHIEGVIQKEGYTYNQEWILETIKSLKEDDKNMGIMLFIDSPGGTVYESDETYLALVDYKNETERPVYAYFASLAASGGYYIGSSADFIFANRNTLTGSIGVLAGQSFDVTGLLDKIGVKSKTFHAGRNKNMLNINEPLTEEQEQIMQSIADDAYEQFTSIVAASRKMKLEEVRKLADGRIYTANQALKNGLIDAIESFENAKKSMAEKEILTNCTFEDFNFEYKESFKDIFRKFSSFVKNPTATSSVTLNYLY